MIDDEDIHRRFCRFELRTDRYASHAPVGKAIQEAIRQAGNLFSMAACYARRRRKHSPSSSSTPEKRCRFNRSMQHHEASQKFFLNRRFWSFQGSYGVKADSWPLFRSLGCPDRWP